MAKSEAFVSIVNGRASSIDCTVALESLSFIVCRAFDASLDKGNELVWTSGLMMPEKLRTHFELQPNNPKILCSFFFVVGSCKSVRTAICFGCGQITLLPTKCPSS